MAGFFTNFATGAMRGALAIQDERQKYAEDQFKRMENVRDKLIEKRSEADQKLATAKGLAERYGVDPSYVLQGMNMDLKGDKLLDYVRFSSKDGGPDKPKPDINAQTNQAMGGQSNPALQAPPAQAPQAPVGPSSIAQAPTTQPTPTPTAAPVQQAPTAPQQQSNGTGAMGALSAALFGGTSNERANDRFRKEYGQEGVDLINGGSRTKLAEESAKTSAYKYDQSKATMAKMLEGIKATDLRPGSEASFLAAMASGNTPEALKYVLSEEKKLDIQHRMRMQEASHSAVAHASANAAYAPVEVQTFVNRSLPKDHPNYMKSVDTRDHAGMQAAMSDPNLMAVPKAFAGKMDDLPGGKTLEADVVKSATAVRNMDQIAQRIKERVKNNPDAATISGTIAEYATSAAADISSLMRMTGTNISVLDPNNEEYKAVFDKIRAPGFERHDVRSNLLMLAYLQAAALGQKGQGASDKDVKAALGMIGAHLNDPEQLTRNLDVVVNRAKDMHGNLYQEWHQKPLPKDYWNSTAKPSGTLSGEMDPEFPAPPMKNGQIDPASLDKTKTYKLNDGRYFKVGPNGNPIVSDTPNFEVK